MVSIVAVWLDNNTTTGIAKSSFTVQSLFTTAGATTAVFTMATVLRSLIVRLDPRWSAAIFSLLIMLVGIKVNGDAYSIPTILVATINAAVIYAAAVGVNNVTTNPRTSGDGIGAQAALGAAAQPPRHVRWFE